jgi:hypothetical protein
MPAWNMNALSLFSQLLLLNTALDGTLMHFLPMPVLQPYACHVWHVASRRHTALCVTVAVEAALQCSHG